jgi:hypothetical protein
MYLYGIVLDIIFLFFLEKRVFLFYSLLQKEFLGVGKNIFLGAYTVPAPLKIDF